MAAHEHPSGTMNRFYVDLVNDSGKPLYIRTILDHSREYWSNWGMPHRMVSRAIRVILVLRSPLRCGLDNFRTKYISVFLGPGHWWTHSDNWMCHFNISRWKCACTATKLFYWYLRREKKQTKKKTNTKVSINLLIFMVLLLL